MHSILIILAAIGGFLAFLLILALFTRKTYSIEREIIINKPRQAVFNYIKYVKNHDHFSKWVLMDSLSKKEYSGMDGTVGFVYAWDSAHKQVGKGEQEITKIIEGERIEFALRFIKPFEGKAVSHLKTSSVSDSQTKVSWGISSRMKYPMNIMLLLMNMDKMLGKDIDTSLTNLKNILEKS